MTDLSTSYKNRNTTQIAPKNTDTAQGRAPGASPSPCWVLTSPGGQSLLNASSPKTSATAPLTSLGCVPSLLPSLCNLDALCFSTAVHAAFNSVKVPLLPPQDPPLSCTARIRSHHPFHPGLGGRRVLTGVSREQGSNKLRESSSAHVIILLL